MKVEDLLTISGGNTNFVIQGTTEKDEIVQVAYGKVEDIKFPLVPYGKYIVEHITVDENILYILLDYDVNFAKINLEHTDINSGAFIGYLSGD